MAGTFLKIETVGDQNVQRFFSRLIQQGQQLEPALAEIGEYLLESHQRRFELEVAPDGALWEPLAPSTIKRKKGDDRILQDTGTMRDTLAYQILGDELHFGSGAEQAASQHFGHEDIPARPFVGLFDGQWNDETEIEAILESHLLDAF
ncbi:MAG: phage virion morphogenesis protein [Aliiglaciecola sp.]